MPTLLSNTKEHVAIPAGQRLTLTVDASGSAIVIRKNGESRIDQVALGASSSMVFGEYLIPIILSITCVSGTLSYTLSQSTDNIAATTGIPSPFTSRNLVATDNNTTQVCASSQTATVPQGLAPGFGVAFRGTIAFTAANGVTVNDIRTTGATNPVCALVQTAADVYDVWGGKA